MLFLHEFAGLNIFRAGLILYFRVCRYLTRPEKMNRADL